MHTAHNKSDCDTYYIVVVVKLPKASIRLEKSMDVGGGGRLALKPAMFKCPLYRVHANSTRDYNIQ